MNINKLYGKLKSWCNKTPNASYTSRSRQYKRKNERNSKLWKNKGNFAIWIQHI